jgi:diguanylate cyclase (GGDEF)-like protein/PAS domain S-box-containing protein
MGGAMFEQLQRYGRTAETRLMGLWPARLAFAVHAWLPLGLAALAPLVLVTVVIPMSRRRGRGIATVLALRTVVVLSAGFALLATTASVAVVQTGLGELSNRHTSDARALADAVERTPLGVAAGDARLRLMLFRQKDPGFGFAVAGADACRAACVLALDERNVDARELERKLVSAWPDSPDQQLTISVSGHPYLLVGAPVRDVSGRPRSGVVLGVNAQALADQAARTAWLLLAMSYALLFGVAFTSWQQVSHSLAKHIETINTQLRLGVPDESHESFDVAGHELRELADSVSAYIKRTLDEKSSSDERYRKLVELAPDAVIMCADTRIRFVNPAAIALAGAKSRNELVSSPIDQFLSFEEGRRESDKTGGLRPATWTRVDGSLRHVEVAEIAHASDGELVRQFLVRDVTHRRAREAALAHRAEHDALTGLVNRARFEALLVETLSPERGPTTAGDDRHVVVFYLDLDGFKPVNDTHGHAAGDAVLVAVADRLRDSTRGTDIIGRLGGDEFAVLLEVRELGEVTIVANRILAAIRKPIATNDAIVTVGASLGIADARTRAKSGAAEPPISAAELLNAADAAMYVAKSKGGDGYRMSDRGDQSPGTRTDVNFPTLV